MHPGMAQNIISRAVCSYSPWVFEVYLNYSKQYAQHNRVYNKWTAMLHGSLYKWLYIIICIVTTRAYNITYTYGDGRCGGMSTVGTVISTSSIQTIHIALTIRQYQLETKF